MRRLKRLSSLSDIFSFNKPEGAFYIFPKIKTGEDAITFAKKLIEKTGVITIPGNGMGPTGAHHLRISFSAPSTIIKRAFDRIKESELVP